MDSNLTSALVGVFAALAGAAIGGLATWKVHLRAETEGRVREFRDIMIEMLDQRIRYVREVMPIEDAGVREQVQMLYGSRVATLRNIAESLLGSVASRLTFQDWLVIGYEYQMAADYQTAHRHYLTAVQLSTADDPLDHAIALRHLALLYYVETSPHFDPDQGAELFARAVAATGSLPDPWLRLTTARTYFLWAQTLRARGLVDWPEKASAARGLLLAMPEWHPSRGFELTSLDTWLAQATAGTTEPAEPVARDPLAGPVAPTSDGAAPVSPAGPSERLQDRPPGQRSDSSG